MKRGSTYQLILIALFAALTAIGARIQIPIPPVPMTLQFFIVLLAGGLLGARLGLFSQLTYIALGLIGLPVFASGAGFTYVLKPTFGYLIGFAIGAFVIGLYLKNKEKSIANFVIANLLALIPAYGIGVTYLYLAVNTWIGKAMPVSAAVAAGFTPFILKDIVVCVVAAIIAQRVAKVVRIENKF
jgi:biotin transport system substrate-specific component